MDSVDFQWLHDEKSTKHALQAALGSSGQLIKKHFDSKFQSRPVRARDLIKLPLDFVNHMRINPLYKGALPLILKESADYLALHKPSEVHCHPHAYSDQDTLLNFLAQTNHWATLCVNENQYDRGLLYRLDFETSGLVILAKNEEFLKKMRTEFSTLMKRKFYWAIVVGDFNQEGEWTHHFRATGAKGSKQVVSENADRDSQEGSLSVKKVMYQNGKSLVLVNLKSGLRHQIRAQLAHLGFPLLGDELYAGQKSERLFLHALRYEWDEAIEDKYADLFGSFFDLDCSLQMSHDMFGRF